jgi:hypothetical protein
MALDTMYCKVCVDRPTPPYPDSVAQLMLRTGLSDQAIIWRSTSLLQDIGDAFNAIYRRPLFIGGQQYSNLTRMFRILGDKCLGGYHHGRYRSFHVSDTTPKQHPIPDFGLKGW